MNHIKDGMRYPSIDQLVTVTHSKYRLVVGAAKRAKALNRKENPEVALITNPHSKKAIGIALEEVVEGKIEIIDIKDRVISPEETSSEEKTSEEN